MTTSQGESERRVPEVDVREARRRAERGEAVIVDVREPEELAQVSVPGALHIPLGDLPERASELPRDRELLMLCRSGNRSGRATEYLLRSGFDRTANIAGGILAWVEQGLPVERGGGSERS